MGDGGWGRGGQKDSTVHSQSAGHDSKADCLFGGLFRSLMFSVTTFWTSYKIPPSKKKREIKG